MMPRCLNNPLSVWKEKTSWHGHVRDQREKGWPALPQRCFFVSAASDQAGPIDELNRLAEQASPSSQSIPETAGTAPVTKFTATGRITEVLAAGGCTNNPTITSLECTPSTNCDSLTMTGTVSATGLGKATLNVCNNIILSTSTGACLNGLGIGTLTAANGHLINIAFGGHLCLSNEVVGPPITAVFDSNLSYDVEGGTGPFATETGNGNLTASDVIVNPSTMPFSGTGEITMTGTLSKN
jgi:hypothetical protein